MEVDGPTFPVISDHAMEMAAALLDKALDAGERHRGMFPLQRVIHIRSLLIFGGKMGDTAVQIPDATEKNSVLNLIFRHSGLYGL